jgi:5'-3' exonuclease
MRDEAGVVENFGVKPVLIPDYLALVGDAADGYPGIAGVGAVTAARLLNTYGGIEEFPPGVLGDQRDLALLFRDLATLRTSAPLFDDVAALRWSGPTDRFEEWTSQFDDARLLDRSRRAADLSRSRGMP